MTAMPPWSVSKKPDGWPPAALSGETRSRFRDVRPAYPNRDTEYLGDHQRTGILFAAMPPRAWPTPDLSACRFVWSGCPQFAVCSSLARPMFGSMWVGHALTCMDSAPAARPSSPRAGRSRSHSASHRLRTSLQSERLRGAGCTPTENPPHLLTLFQASRAESRPWPQPKGFGQGDNQRHRELSGAKPADENPCRRRKVGVICSHFYPPEILGPA